MTNEQTTPTQGLPTPLYVIRSTVEMDCGHPHYFGRDGSFDAHREEALEVQGIEQVQQVMDYIADIKRDDFPMPVIEGAHENPPKARTEPKITDLLSAIFGGPFEEVHGVDPSEGISFAEFLSQAAQKGKRRAAEEGRPRQMRAKTHDALKTQEIEGDDSMVAVDRVGLELLITIVKRAVQLSYEVHVTEDDAAAAKAGKRLDRALLTFDDWACGERTD